MTSIWHSANNDIFEKDTIQRSERNGIDNFQCDVGYCILNGWL